MKIAASLPEERPSSPFRPSNGEIRWLRLVNKHLSAVTHTAFQFACTFVRQS